MAESIDEPVRALLEDKNFSMVATIRKDGSPHVVPTWVDTDGSHVLLNSAEGRVWPANLRRDKRVTITVPNLQNPYEYAEIRGTLAEATTHGADEHIDKLAKKYMDADSYPFRKEGEQRLVLKITPERVRHYSGG
jgi:PPOX class probable F420-dependent enzyme